MITTALSREGTKTTTEQKVCEGVEGEGLLLSVEPLRSWFLKLPPSYMCLRVTSIVLIAIPTVFPTMLSVVSPLPMTHLGTNQWGGD